MSDKCKYEPCNNEPLPYPRYEGYCSQQCMDADEIHQLEIKLEKAERENAELIRQNEDYDQLGLEVLKMKKTILHLCNCYDGNYAKALDDIADFIRGSK